MLLKLLQDYRGILKNLPTNFKKILKKNAKVLEIGSNDCTLLDYIKKKGINVIGVDPAKSIKINNSIKVYKNLFNYKFSKTLKKNIISLTA